MIQQILWGNEEKDRQATTQNNNKTYNTNHNNQNKTKENQNNLNNTKDNKIIIPKTITKDNFTFIILKL